MKYIHKFLKSYGLLAITLTLIPTLSLSVNQSFSKAKKTLLKSVYFDHHITFYCRVPFEVKRINGKQKAVVDPAQKGFLFRKNRKRASRIEWEHVMPAEQFGGSLACWYSGNPRCLRKGKNYKGRKCCEKVSKEFRLMQADMTNLVPAIGEVNGDRSNFRYMDTSSNIIGQYGLCPMKIDFKGRKAYPAQYTKGFIGRDYLYMAKKYHIHLSSRERKMMRAWSHYPKTSWEILRNKRIITLERR